MAWYMGVDIGSSTTKGVIAGSGDHYDPRINQRACGSADWIVFVGTDCWRTQAHVDHANVVLIFVERIAGANRLGWIGRTQNPVKRIQKSGCATCSRRVQHSQIDDSGSGRNAVIATAHPG